MLVGRSGDLAVLKSTRQQSSRSGNRRRGHLVRRHVGYLVAPEGRVSWKLGSRELAVEKGRAVCASREPSLNDCRKQRNQHDRGRAGSRFWRFSAINLPSAVVLEKGSDKQATAIISAWSKERQQARRAGSSWLRRLLTGMGKSVERKASTSG